MEINPCCKKLSALCGYMLLGTLCLVTGDVACAQEVDEPDLSEIVRSLRPEEITLGLIDSALPRQSEERFLFRLRSAMRGPALGPDLESEDSLKTCVVIGALFTAVRWDWALFMQSQSRGKDLPGLNFVMETNLVQITHRLKKLGAPQGLIELVDTLKARFGATTDTLTTEEFSRIDQGLDRVAKALRNFLIPRYDWDLSFRFGEWLVWQAELSNLCLSIDGQRVDRFTRAMNRLYQTVNMADFLELCDRVVARSEPFVRAQLREALTALQALFLVEDLQGVDEVRSAVHQIFALLDLSFPGIG